MPSLKTIKTKIKSTGNLKKISRALEIISTIKLQKNKAKVESAKQYFLELAKLVSQISQYLNIFDIQDQKLVTSKKRNLVIVITSEKGLC
jgi:F-type H+-transporting ATPase subunit gamma